MAHSRAPQQHGRAPQPPASGAQTSIIGGSKEGKARIATGLLGGDVPTGMDQSGGMIRGQRR